MESTKGHFRTIDEYINSFPDEVRNQLQALRQAIKEEAPEAEEAISYQMPTFTLHGNLVHFAAYKNHIGFYPTPSGVEAFIAELSPYKTGKGTLQFPLDQPLPLPLIRKVVKLRVKENLEKKAKKK
jgi:uncharacterized protein YdhG (YjbR/CyaY superfamily)